MKTKVAVTLALASLSSLCCGEEVSMVNGAEYFNLVPGTTWTLRNEQYPERITTITVEGEGRQRRGGALTLVFRKNHQDTYHGAGKNNNLIWYVTKGETWIKAGNSNGSDAVGDAFPDDIRYDRTTGERIWNIWLHSLSADLPACYLAPAGNFEVPSQRTGYYQYFAKYVPNGWTGWSAVGMWRVRWSMWQSDVLLVQFDETYPDGSGVYEDWYLRRGHGLIGIRQYTDASRETLKLSVWE